MLSNSNESDPTDQMWMSPQKPAFQFESVQRFFFGGGLYRLFCDDRLSDPWVPYGPVHEKLSPVARYYQLLYRRAIALL